MRSSRLTFVPFVLPAPFSKRDALLLSTICLSVAATLMWLFRGVTLDDAYITFRYARHLAEGYGLGAWNHTGPHVEGYSSPLWMVILAGAAWLGTDLIVASKVIGISAALVAMVVLFRRRDDRAAILTGVFLAVYIPFVLYAASSMETVFFTNLVTMTLVGPPGWQPIVAPLLVATRPEGALVAGIGVLSLASRREWRSAVPTAVTTGLMFATIMIHRWVAYGALAPNTYYAKVAGGGLGHVQIGLVYVGTWMLAHSPVLAVLAIGAWKRVFDRRDATCLTLLAVYVVYMASAGGDPPSAFPLWRQFVHIAPAWVLPAMSGLMSLFGDRRWRQVALAGGLAVLASVGALLVQGTGGKRPDIGAYNQWIASISSPTTTISSSYGGALPYLVDAVHIDALGLSTPYIARHGTFDPDGPQDSKSDMGWVMAQRPDIVEGYVSGLALLRGAPADEVIGTRRRKMNLEMVMSPVFQREYVFVRNAPYDRMDRSVFLRRDFWEAHPQHAALDCIPVADTTLAAFAGAAQ